MTGDRGQQAEHVFRGHSGRISLALALGWLAFLLGRETIPLVLPTVIEDLAITDSQAGAALTVMWATYALSHFPAGRLADRLTNKTVLIPSLVLAVGGFGVLSMSRSFAGMVLAVILIGGGGGAYYVATRGLLADTFVERRGEAFGVQIAAGSIGSALASALAIAALALGPWQSAFVVPALLLVAVTVALNYYASEPYEVGTVDLDLRTTLRTLVEPPQIRQVLVVYILFAFVWQGTIGFLPTFLQSYKGLSPVLTSAAFATLYVVGMAIGPIAGNVSDRFGRIKVAGAALVLSAAGLVALIIVSAVPLVFASVVVFAVGIRSFPPVMQAFLFSQFTADSSAGNFGALKTVYTGLGSLGPLYVGVVAGATDYGVAFSGYAVFLFLAAAVLVAGVGLGQS